MWASCPSRPPLPQPHIVHPKSEERRRPQLVERALSCLSLYAVCAVSICASSVYRTPPGCTSRQGSGWDCLHVASYVASQAAVSPQLPLQVMEDPARLPGSQFTSACAKTRRNSAIPMTMCLRNELIIPFSFGNSADAIAESSP